MARETPVIMLVDDDIDFLEMNRHVLESRGYRTVCATAPCEALATMGNEKPSLVITDLMMQALDSGFSFSKQIKQDRRFANVPVIIVTSVSSRRGFDFTPRTPEELDAICADAFFDKPVPFEVLLAKIEELLMGCTQEDDT